MGFIVILTIVVFSLGALIALMAFCTDGPAAFMWGVLWPPKTPKKSKKSKKPKNIFSLSADRRKLKLKPIFAVTG